LLRRGGGFIGGAGGFIGGGLFLAPIFLALLFLAPLLVFIFGG
jgi:hypothetical protein